MAVEGNGEVGVGEVVRVLFGETYLRKELRRRRAEDGGGVHEVATAWVPHAVATCTHVGVEYVVAEILNGSGKLYLFGWAEWARFTLKDGARKQGTAGPAAPKVAGVLPNGSGV